MKEKTINIKNYEMTKKAQPFNCFKVIHDRKIKKIICSVTEGKKYTVTAKRLKVRVQSMKAKQKPGKTQYKEWNKSKKKNERQKLEGKIQRENTEEEGKDDFEVRSLKKYLKGKEEQKGEFEEKTNTKEELEEEELDNYFKEKNGKEEFERRSLRKVLRKTLKRRICRKIGEEEFEGIAWK